MQDTDQISYKNTLQFIFMNYSLVEAVETRKNLKIFKGYENYSLKSVLIKIHKFQTSLESIDDEPTDYMNYNFDLLKRKEDQFTRTCKTKNHQNNYDHETLYQIIKILDNSALPRTILEEVVSNYKIIIQEIPEGTAITDIESLTNFEFFSIFNQLLNLLSLLNMAKIKIPEITCDNILRTKENIIRIKELKYAYFTDESNEFESIVLLKNIFMTLEPKINEIKNEKFKNLEKIFQNKLCTLESLRIHEICKVCDIIFDYNVPLISFLDYLVLNEIQKLGFKKFEIAHVNDKTKKEFFIYRIVEKYISKSKLPLISKITPEIKIQNNQEYHYVDESKANIQGIDLTSPLIKEIEQTKSIIKKRCEVLNEYIQFSAPPCNLFACQSNAGLIYLEIPLFNPEKYSDILKILRLLKLEAWMKDDKIMVDDLSVGLSVIICLSGMNTLIFYKNQGENENFLKLVSEILEIMKYIQ